MANIITQEGLDKLKEELDYLITVKRKQISEALKEAREQGDLSENSEYDEAREEQGKVESRIAELTDLISKATVIDEAAIHSDIVSVGHTVRVFNKTRNKEFVYSLVGSTEANAMIGKISDQSPIGEALIGEKVGAIVKVTTPAGLMELEILEIM